MASQTMKNPVHYFQSQARQFGPQFFTYSLLGTYDKFEVVRAENPILNPFDGPPMAFKCDDSALNILPKVS